LENKIDDYQRFIHASRYARWRDDIGRRETWEETVQRLIEYYRNICDDIYQTPKGYISGQFEREFAELEAAIVNMEVMPSMRAMMTAGPALDRCNVGAYNCAYLPVDSPRSFDEAMYILMCGTGVGFSVEEKYVSQLPRISEYFDYTDTTIVVADSKEGWAKSLRELITLLIAGQVPKWDTSNVRPAGSRLVTFGGRASGPEPLERLFEFCVSVFKRAAGRRLTSLECHDLMCMVADVVVVGGVRRSAMISLSDLGSEAMATAKSGSWWEGHVHRQLANNSAVYNGKPEIGEFLKEWKALYDSKSGERGIFNRDASKRIVEKLGKRDPNFDFGTNPCSEIILRPFQFCNLTEVVVRPEDDFASLARKVRLATILGTIQSTFTDFRYLRKIWQKNTEEERLLGVSLTGIADNEWVFNNRTYAEQEELLQKLKKVANDTNAEWADRLGINKSAAITCVKPSGTVSQLVNSASGIHPRWSAYYLRTVRNDAKDPITRFLMEAGVPAEPDQRNPSAVVFSFPQKSPSGSIVRSDLDALSFLETWKWYQENWCEHKPSVTISVKEDEWLDVASWCYRNFDLLSGVSFLPFDPTEYPQAPYQTLTEEQYNEWVQKMPKSIDWSKLAEYEREDNTTGSFELACVAGVCEI
jgi:ribonucleoside-diphosphate reductase alpha chain